MSIARVYYPLTGALHRMCPVCRRHLLKNPGATIWHQVRHQRTGSESCEPIGLLEQDEDGEVDHKVLAALPGQEVEVGPGLQQELRDFIVAGFAQFPEVGVQVGRILSREAALQHIQVCRAAKEETSAGG